MKNLGKLKLNQLSKIELRKKEMILLTGGDGNSNSCNCGCSNNNVVANRDANAVYGYQNSAGYGDLSDGGDGSVTCGCSGGFVMQNVRANP